MDTKASEISLLDQVLHSSFPGEVPQDVSIGPILDEMLSASELNEVDLDILLRNDSSLNNVEPVDYNQQIFPELLPYSTPPYSPSDDNGQVPKTEVSAVPTQPCPVNPPNVVVKPEAPSFDAYHQHQNSQWINSLLSTAMPMTEAVNPSSPASSSGSTSAMSMTDLSKIEATLSGITSKGTSSSEVERLKASLRREERLRKNRESSCISRKRRKEYLQSLQDRLKEAASKNSLLLQENDILRKKVQCLEEENNRLKSSSSPATLSTNGRVAVMVVVVMVVFSVSFLPTRTSLFKTPMDQSVVETGVVSSSANRRLMSVEDTPSEAISKTRALVVRKSGARASGKQDVQAQGSVVLQGTKNAQLPRTVVKQPIYTFNQSVEEELQTCFKMWKKQSEKKPVTSVSTLVLESCKRLLSQIPSDHYYELMLQSDSRLNSEKILQSQSLVPCFVWLRVRTCTQCM
jgi:hypothetical protein